MTSYIDYLETLSKKQLMVMLARQRHEETQAIAVVGLGCRLPGGIDDPLSLWATVREGRAVPTESAGPPTDSLGRPRWNLAAPDLAPMADVLRSGAYLSDVDLFDADYFGIGEDEAMRMDPQQRLILEVAVQALADANLTRAELRRRRVGVFIGASTVEYPIAFVRNGGGVDQLSPHAALGNTLSATSGRLGYLLGVNGPAMTIETSSSSALTALHLAAQALRRRECDVALVGACQLLLSPYTTAVLAKPGMLSAAGRSRPFTTEADGHVRGEGCGVLVLKRQADARTDGDSPYALVRGTAVYSHGDRPAMAVSAAAGQKTVIDLALRGAGVAPAEVGYVEAQANGSRLGAIIETEALAEAYERTSPEAPPLYVGSAKANLGYLETASGAVSLLKTALVLAHGEIPPQIGADKLDPSIPWDRTGLRVADKALPWPGEGRRLAGVSSFGFTGINAHAVLESAPPVAADPDPAGTPWPLLLSAHQPAALAATAARLHAYLAERVEWSVADVCRTLAVGRDQQRVRYAAVVDGREQLLAALADAAAGGAGVTGTAGVFVHLPGLAGEELRTAVTAALADGPVGVGTRLRAHAEAMGLPAPDPAAGLPDGYALAWALAWYDRLAAAGLRPAGAVLGGPYRHLLAEVVTGTATSADVAARWPSAGPPPAAAPSGQVSVAGDEWTVRGAAAAGATPVRPAELDARGWWELVAAQFAAGEAVAAGTGPARLRLPGPVLIGRSYWPDGYLWS